MLFLWLQLYQQQQTTDSLRSLVAVQGHMGITHRVGHHSLQFLISGYHPSLFDPSRNSEKAVVKPRRRKDEEEERMQKKGKRKKWHCVKQRWKGGKICYVNSKSLIKIIPLPKTIAFCNSICLRCVKKPKDLKSSLTTRLLTHTKFCMSPNLTISHIPLTAYKHLYWVC